MYLLSSPYSSMAVQVKVKYISLSLIGVSAVAGITYEEISGSKITGLVSRIGKLFPADSLSGGGKKLVQA